MVDDLVLAFSTFAALIYAVAGSSLEGALCENRELVPVKDGWKTPNAQCTNTGCLVSSKMRQIERGLIVLVVANRQRAELCDACPVLSPVTCDWMLH
jgi:hypothetical protein